MGIRCGARATCTLHVCCVGSGLADARHLAQQLAPRAGMRWVRKINFVHTKWAPAAPQKPPVDAGRMELVAAGKLAQLLPFIELHQADGAARLSAIGGVL